MLKKDGIVYGCGHHFAKQLTPIIKDDSVIDVSATISGLLLLTADNLLAMGEDTRGELGAGLNV